MTSSGLITDSDLSSLNTVVNQLVVNVQGHTNLSIVDSHQNVTIDPNPVFDNSPLPYDDSPNSPLGNKVGDVALVIEANGFRYRIPASLRPTGPAKVATSIGISPAQAFSFAPEGALQPPVLITCTFSATQPTTVTWETMVGSNWVAINASYCYANGVQYAPNTGSHTYGYNAGGSSCQIIYPGGSQAKTSGDMTVSSPTIASGLATSQSAILTLPFNSDDTTGKIYLGKIRLKIDNSAVGGGIKYSAVVPCYLEDQTGSWICGAVHDVSPLTQQDRKALSQLKAWCIEHHPEETTQYLGTAGAILVRKMRDRNVDFSPYRQSISNILAKPTSEESFVAYKQMVLELIQQYWPDCNLDYVKQQRG